MKKNLLILFFFLRILVQVNKAFTLSFFLLKYDINQFNSVITNFTLKFVNKNGPLYELSIKYLIVKGLQILFIIKRANITILFSNLLK